MSSVQPANINANLPQEKLKSKNEKLVKPNLETNKDGLLTQAQEGEEMARNKMAEDRAGRDQSQPSLGVVYMGNKKVELRNLGKPKLLGPADAIVRITTTALCGTDLHVYNKEYPSSVVQKTHTVMGHEAVGIVESVGQSVQRFRKGDRVVVSSVVMCGECEYCKSERPSLCSSTNYLDQEQKNMMGHTIAATFGMQGGLDGLQAEHARVPNADLNLLKLPENVADEAAVFLSDNLCTAWHAMKIAEVDEKTKSLCIWGAGPVGLLATYLAKYLGVSRVFVIDHHESRLDRARKLGAETMHFGEEDVRRTLLSKLPEGAEKCIDFAGFRFPLKLRHKFQRAVGLETDSPDIIDQMVQMVKRGGNVALVGEYIGTANSFPIGAIMEKGITLRGGHAWVQRYWQELLGLMENGSIDPTVCLSHVLEFGAIAEAYKTFCDRDEGVIKIVLKTQHYDQNAGARRFKTPFFTASVIGATA